MGINKRKFPRISLNFDCQYKIKGSKVAPIKIVRLGKLSISGVQIFIKKEIKKNSIIELLLRLPNSVETFNIEARVVFCGKNEKGEFPPYKLGLEFIKMDSIVKASLKSALDDAFANLDWESMV